MSHSGAGGRHDMSAEVEPQTAMTRRMREFIEELSEKVHMAWLAEKEKQGFHPPMMCPERPSIEYLCPARTKDQAPDDIPVEVRDVMFVKCCGKCHADMYFYRHLPENVKEYDRVTVRSVLCAISDVMGD